MTFCQNEKETGKHAGRRACIGYKHTPTKLCFVLVIRAPESPLLSVGDFNFLEIFNRRVLKKNLVFNVFLMNFYVFSFHSDSSVRREEVGKERGT
jgi:hypothetical protein